MDIEAPVRHAPLRFQPAAMDSGSHPAAGQGDANVRRAKGGADKVRLGRDVFKIAIDMLRIGDAGVIVISGLVANIIYLWLRRWQIESNYLSIIFGAGVLTPIVFSYCGCYAARGRRIDRIILKTGAIGCLTLFTVIVIIGFLSKTSTTVSRIWIVTWIGLALSSALALRLILLTTLNLMAKNSVYREAVAIVGATPLAAQVAEHLRSRSTHPVDVVGVFDDRQGARTPSGIEVDGSIDDLIAIGQSVGVSHIVLAIPWTAEARVGEILQRLKSLSVDISVCPDEMALRVLGKPLNDIGGLRTFSLAERPLRQWKLLAKQVEDWVLGGLLLLLLSPLMAIIALAIRLDSPGPILFKQRRHGYNNLEITIYKFRTMQVDMADDLGARQTSRVDPRITRLGAFLRRSSLDELPQLLNVMTGDMSLVGPRPHPVGMRTENLLGGEIVQAYAHRHRVRPGITGWAQIHGYRGATESVTDLLRRVEYDLDYIDRCSVLLDLQILLATPFKILSTKNAF